MNANANVIKIEGLPTDEPTLGHTAAGAAVMNIRMAHNPKPTQSNPNPRKTFINASYFEADAEQVYEQLMAQPKHGVGQLVAVRGKLATQGYQSVKYNCPALSSYIIASSVVPMAKSANVNSALIEGTLFWVGKMREWGGTPVVNYTLTQTYNHPITGAEQTAYLDCSSWADDALTISQQPLGTLVQAERHLQQPRKPYMTKKGVRVNTLTIANASVSIPLAAAVAVPQPVASKVKRITSGKTKATPVATDAMLIAA